MIKTCQKGYRASDDHVVMSVKKLQTWWDDPKGWCYAASEALYYYLGGVGSGLFPHQARIDLKTHKLTREVSGRTVSHWWLEDWDGNVVDPTADQFDFEFPYHLGRGRPFRPNMKADSKELLECLGSLTCSALPVILSAMTMTMTNERNA